jgi:polyphosphate kinase
VEVLVALPSAESVEEIGKILDVAFDEGTAAWELDPDGVWNRRATGPDEEPLLDLQSWLVTTSRAVRRR